MRALQASTAQGDLGGSSATGAQGSDVSKDVSGATKAFCRGEVAGACTDAVADRLVEETAAADRVKASSVDCAS